MIYNAPANEQKQLGKNGVKVYCSTSRITSENCCGTIDSMFFRVNIRAFSEAKQFNSCLNKKIAIDKRGKIRNCPSMKNSFGSVQETNLQDALDQEGFKAYWEITKDKINTCKICEFRYMCSDCRAYVEQPDDAFSKPLKCGYDPRTGEWKEWSTNPLKQEAMKHYGFRKRDKENTASS
jgi:SPASM domain peptide maturase of grasp-with-spasm system